MPKEDVSAKKRLQEFLADLQTDCRVLREIQARQDQNLETLSESVSTLTSIVGSLTEQYRSSQETLAIIRTDIQHNHQQINRIDNELQRMDVKLDFLGDSQSETSDKQDEMVTACALKQQEIAGYAAAIQDLQETMDEIKTLIRESNEKALNTEKNLAQCEKDVSKLFTWGQVIAVGISTAVGGIGLMATLQSMGYSLF